MPVAEPARFSPQARPDMPESGIFRNIFARGYRSLLPIVPPGAQISERSTLYARKDAVGKIPGVMGGDGCWRGFDWLKHETTEADLDRWSAWGAGVGLRLGNGLLALDCDTLDQSLSELVFWTLQDVVRAPAVHVRRFGRRPKWLVLLRCLEDIRYTRVEFAGYEGLKERVELLGNGRQCVVAGVHPGTGRAYEWEDTGAAEGLPPLSAIPYVNAAQIGALFKRLAESLPQCSGPLHEGGERAPNQELLRGKVEDLRKAVGALPNTTKAFPTRNDYLKVGYALKAALPDDEPEALDLFLQWCGRWSDDPDGRRNEPDKVLADWKRMKGPYGLGAGWIYEQADRLGGGGFNAGEVWFQPVEGSEGSGDVWAAAEAAQAKIARLPDIGLKEAADRWAQECAEPLVEGLLDKGAMTVLYGKSNVGKTFVAMDIAAHVATGEPWGGRRCAQGVVVYVVAEGSRGAYKRAAALRKKLAGLDSAPFRFIMHPVDLRTPLGDLRSLLEALKAIESDFGQIALVVVDTLSRALAGGDENSSQDMGDLVRHFDLIRNSTHAHVLIVHHSGKEAGKGARGHSLLRAAIDTELEIVDGEIKVEKQRDMEAGAPIRFELEGVTLGVDAYEKPVTSATVRLPNAMEPPRPTEIGKPSKKEQCVFEAVLALTDDMHGKREGATVAEIAAHLLAQGHDIQLPVLRTMLRRLNEKNLARPFKRGKWVAYSDATYNGETRERGIETSDFVSIFD